jgi:hypothetical protein
MMNTQLNMEEQHNMTTYRQTSVTDLGDLVLNGFTVEPLLRADAERGKEVRAELEGAILLISRTNV